MDINTTIDNLITVFEYWKNMLKLYGIDTGIVIMTGRYPEVDSIVMEMIPFLMDEKKYRDIVIAYESDEVYRKAVSKLKESVNYQKCSSEMIDGFCRLQNLTSFFDNIFVTQTEMIDDADTFLLEGYSGLELWYIVGKVILQLSEVPDKEKAKQRFQDMAAGKTFGWERFSGETVFNIERYSSREEFQAEKIRKLIVDGNITGDSRIILYGATKTTNNCINLLENCQEVMIVDRDEDKWGVNEAGIRIVSPEDGLLPYDSNRIILVSLYHYKEVCEYLCSLGYEPGEQVFLINPAMNLTNNPSDGYHEEISRRLKKGFEVYEALKVSDRNEMILLSPWNATGDIYIDCLYLPFFLEENNISKYRIVVSNLGAKKIAALFNYEAELVSEEDAFAILDLARAIGFEKLNILNINVNVKKQRIGKLDRDVDFNTLHQRLVFNSDIRRSVPSIRQEDSEVYFEKNGLKKGRTALISPYTGTFGCISEEICIKMVEMLKDMGYTICTNTAPGEEAIPGTLGLFIPYSCVIDFVDKAGLFIGMRSGLCDIISSTSARMIVFHNGYHLVFFGLQSMGLKSDRLLELVREDVSGENVVGLIKEFCCGE